MRRWRREMTTLPSGWEHCKLPDIAHIVMGQSPDSKTYNHSGDGLPFFQGKAEFGDLFPTVNLYCSQPNKIAKQGATLLSVRAPVGPTNLAEHECCIGRGLAAFHPCGGIEPKFILHLFRSMEPVLSGKGTGSTFKAVTKGFVEGLECNLPPLPEQHRIVSKIEELFSELDKGVESLNKARKQLKVYRQAVLKHAFEGKLTAKWRQENQDKLEKPEQLLARIKREREARYEQLLEDWKVAVNEWEQNDKKGKKPAKPKKIKKLRPFDPEELEKLPDIESASWKWIKVDEICSHTQNSIKAGPFGSALKKQFYVPDGYKIYGQEQVISGDPYCGSYFIDLVKYEELETCKIAPKDVLISLVGTVGKVLVLPDDCREGIINPRLIKITLNLNYYRPEFFKCFFESAFVRGLYKTLAKGTTMDVLNLGIIQNLPFPLCSLAEQDKLVAELESKLSVVDQIEKEAEAELKKSEALRQSILKNAFSGKLIAQNPNDESASILLDRISAAKNAEKPRAGA